jgi:predicted nucleotidyltransferase
MIHLEFCDKYSYPGAVKEVFRTLLSPIDSRKIKSVVLFGSSSVGEMGYSVNDGTLQVYSDYDLLLIATGDKDKAYARELSRFYRSLEKNRPEKFPSVEFIYSNTEGFTKWFRNRPDSMYAIKHAGVTIFGEDATHIIRPVGEDEGGPLFVVDLLLGHFWDIVLSVPGEMLTTGDLSEQDTKRFSYFLCKMYLQLMYWHLKAENVFCLSYREVIDRIKKGSDDLRLWELMTIDVDFLEECYAGKTRLSFSRDPLALYGKICEEQRISKRFLFSYFGIDAKAEGTTFSNVSGIPTPGDSFRRKVYDGYLAMSKVRPFRLKDAIQWFFCNKYYLMFDYLHAGTIAVYYYLHEEHDKARRALEDAHMFLRKIALNRNVLDEMNRGDFPQKWLSLRSMASEFRYTYFPSVRFKRKKPVS